MIDKYEALKQQVEFELECARKSCEKALRSEDTNDYMHARGCLFAYKSIMSKIKSLDGESFDWGD